MSSKISMTVLFFFIGVGLIILPRSTSIIGSHVYSLTDKLSLCNTMLYLLSGWLFISIPRLLKSRYQTFPFLMILVINYIAVAIISFYIDIHFIYLSIKLSHGYFHFSNSLTRYIRAEWWFYALLAFGMISNFLLEYFLVKKFDKTEFKILPLSPLFLKAMTAIFLLLLPLFLLWPLEIINLDSYSFTQMTTFQYLPFSFSFIANTLYAFSTLGFVFGLYMFRSNIGVSLKKIKKITTVAGVISSISLCLSIILLIFPYVILSINMNELLTQIIFSSFNTIKIQLITISPILMVFILLAMLRKILKKSLFNNDDSVSNTTGNFGTAAWASRDYLEKQNMYHSNNGLFVGNDMQGRALYMPLLNKLTISPPGGGKTTSSSIPLLLTHNGPAFVFDVKGELWAVTARHRAEVMGRDVVVIDPFGVTKSEDFRRGKPEVLCKDYHINPFDWIPEDKKKRDRMLNVFAASLVINERGFINHFDENAKILIRGYTDYLMHQDKSQRFSPVLYGLMSEDPESAKLTFDQMSQLNGRAGAAANQISRVGSDERGSILSTSYRQIDWMGDSNIQDILSESNFNLSDFLKGNMDIFVVLPEDQVKEHSRLFRMILCLLISQIIQARPSELPDKKMVFLLEEIAQLGASPDIEQCIEVLRARGVVVWTVFQALKQIYMFEKPDLFLSVPLIQIFTNSDKETREWVQTLGGEKTVFTRTISNNKGDSRQKAQIFGGSVSSGEGESIHETGAKLIQLNEIREMPKDEQYIFLEGVKAIRAKKVRYFEHPAFAGMYDENPLESRN